MKGSRRKTYLALLLVFALTGTFVFAESPEPQPQPTPAAEQTVNEDHVDPTLSPNEAPEPTLLTDEEETAMTPSENETSEDSDGIDSEEPEAEAVEDSLFSAEAKDSAPASEQVTDVNGVQHTLYITAEDAQAAHDAECTCGSSLASPVSEEIILSYASLDSEQHNVTKLSCGHYTLSCGNEYYVKGTEAVISEAHTYSADSVCAACGYTCNHLDANGDSLGKAAWNSDNTDITSFTCKACGQPITCKNGGAHVWNTYYANPKNETTWQYSDVTATTHTSTAVLVISSADCSQCGVRVIEGKQTLETKTEQPHVYGDDGSCACGAFSARQVKLTAVSSSDITVESSGSSSKKLSVKVSPSNAEYDVSFSTTALGNAYFSISADGTVSGKAYINESKNPVTITVTNDKNSVSCTVNVVVEISWDDLMNGGSSYSGQGATAEPTTAPTTAAEASSVSLDTMTFGSYPINDTETAEPISWFVLEQNEERTVLISQYALFGYAFNKSSEATDETLVTWENSSIRQQLNDTFYNTAFSDAEKALIRSVTVETVITDENGETQTITTEDSVHLLSAEETLKYFEKNEERKCAASTQAIALTGVYADPTTLYCWWWTRDAINASSAAAVPSDGTVSTAGIDMSMPGIAVRPVIVIGN